MFYYLKFIFHIANQNNIKTQKNNLIFFKSRLNHNVVFIQSRQSGLVRYN